MHPVIDLLPYDEQTLLTSHQEKLRVLQLLLFLYSETQDAIRLFLEKKYTLFDPQVSENLCQIRAYKLIHIVENPVNINAMVSFNEKLQLLLTNNKIVPIKSCDSSQSRLNNISTPISLQALLINYQLNIDFPDVAYFISQIYILSKYKLTGDFNIPNRINYDYLISELNVFLNRIDFKNMSSKLVVFSKSFLKKFIHQLQRNVSKISCEYIFQLQSDISKNLRYTSMLDALYEQDEVKRHVMPCYEVTNVILEHASTRSHFVAVIVYLVCENNRHRFTFILKSCLTTQKYVLSSLDEASTSEALISFVGVCHYEDFIHESEEAYINRFMSFELRNIILYNMAQHPQYAGLRLESKKHNPYLVFDDMSLPKSQLDYATLKQEKFLKDKGMAAIVGCSPKNARLFLLTHVLTCSLKEILQLST